MATKTSKPRPRTFKLKNGKVLPIREATLKTPEEREAAIERAAGSIKTKVVVDRSFYRNGR